MSFDIYAHRERRPMSIDEDLVATGVPEAASLLLVAKQSVWKASEGSELRFVALTADVDDDPLTAGHGAVVSASCLPVAVDRRHFQRRRLGPPCLVFATDASSSSSYECDADV